jgi:hypothetical protein
MNFVPLSMAIILLQHRYVLNSYKNLHNLDISVILTPHFGHTDPPWRKRVKSRSPDKITFFFAKSLL